MHQVWAHVTAIVRDEPQLMEVEALCASTGASRRALLYPQLTPRVQVGDLVALNTTAQDLGLGTGGYDFVMAVADADLPAHNELGHIMKLRYTPVQHRVLSVEEPDSPHALTFTNPHNLFLQQMPVVCASLHSQVAPIAGMLRVCHPCVRIVYIMTDHAALPLALSRLVVQLKESGVIDATITCGQAFGGDYEAVTLYSALIAAKYVCQADVAIVALGPGTVGTSTVWGTTGIAQGEALNAVGVLRGRAVTALRMSEADPRPRHRGISAHSITSLTLVASAHPSTVVLPSLADRPSDISELVSVILGAHDYFDPHTLEEALPPAEVQAHAQHLLADAGVVLSSMGRHYEDDPLFFDAAFAAGYYTAQLL